MSSLLRRMEIRGLKARGYGRTRYRIEPGIDGRERPVPVARGGLILDPDDEPVGYRWPRVADLRQASA